MLKDAVASEHGAAKVLCDGAGAGGKTITPEAHPQGFMSRIIVTADLVYGAYSRSRLDLFVPEGVEQPPLVMLIHGGGWSGGHRLQYLQTAYALARRGFAAATVGYPLAPGMVWPEMGHQVYAAAVWLRQHAPELGFDGSRMVTWGSSAGSHLALCLQAFGGDWRRQGRVSGDMPEIVGTVAQCVAFDLISANDPSWNVFMAGAPPETVSPVHMDPRRLRSVFVSHSRPDDLFPWAQVAAWVQRLRQNGVDAEMSLSEIGEHGFCYNLATEAAQAAFEKSIPYLERVFDRKARNCGTL